jgi:hypothetical protein
MRYLFGFLCVCALGLMPLVGCSEGECQNAEDCDDQNACTDDHCEFVTGDCIYSPVYDGQACDFDGLAGVCIDGVCGEDPCAGDPCDDGNECTRDKCDFRDGSCRNENLNTTACDWDGVPGICVDGVCGEDLCKGVECDDGNECTMNHGCNFRDGSCGYTHWDSGAEGIYYCDWDGVSGICIDGVCEEDPCNSVVCDDDDLCTHDWCRPTEGECTDDTCAWNGTCYFPTVWCDDGNICTDPTCDPETGECYHIPVDGGSCCLRWGPCYTFCFCIPGPCSDECYDWGHCQNGQCV